MKAWPRSFAFVHGLEHRPEPLRKRIVEVHAGNRLHHAAVAESEADAIHVLHAADIRTAVVRDRDLGVAAEHAGHARDPEQLVAELPIDELVDVAEVLLEFPGPVERRCHELDQGFRVVGRDVRMGQRRAERARMRRLRDMPLRRDPERLPLDALQAAREHALLARVHQAGQAAFEERSRRVLGISRPFCGPRQS